MADDNWAPKTRDDWRDLFADGMQAGIAKERSRIEEEQAKKGTETPPEDKTGKDGGNGDGKSKSFADRLLGI